MSKPIKPAQLNNTFTDEEYNAIYDCVNKIMQNGINDHNDKYHYMTKLTNNGFIAILSPEGFDPIIAKKLKSLATQFISDPSNVGFLFARYTWDSGDAPTLMPHCDKSEKYMGLYGTVELNKTIDWDFYVEDEKFEMNKNSSVWFTGTHQPHWRPDKEFGPNDYYDILLCQTHSSSDNALLSEEEISIMDKKATSFSLKYKDTLLQKGWAKQYSEDGCQ